MAIDERGKWVTDAFFFENLTITDNTGNYSCNILVLNAINYEKEKARKDTHVVR